MINFSLTEMKKAYKMAQAKLRVCAKMLKIVQKWSKMPTIAQKKDKKHFFVLIRQESKN